jgi:choline kinase
MSARAIILAAGKGSRLGALADGLPKCLLQLGGRALVRRQLDVLAEAGVSPVLLVVGYAADLVRESVGQAAEYVMNPRYETTNSLASFVLAKDWIKGPVVVMNSDILFDPEVLDDLLIAGEDSLAYDSSSGAALEHMKVAVRDGRVVDLSKELPKEQAAGENVGMLYLSERAARAVAAKGEELIAAGRAKAFLAEAVRAVLPDFPLRAVDVKGSLWTEIDAPSDLEHARKDLWPLISERLETRGSALKRVRRRRRWTSWTGIAAALLVSFAAALFVVARWLGPVWEDVSVAEGRKAVITLFGIRQEWIRLEGAESASVELLGPRSVRVDARCMLPKGEEGPVPYVVEIRVDGKLQDWHKFRAIRDPRATDGPEGVADRDYVLLELPEGPHTVQIRRVAGDVPAMLVRFRVPAP